MVVAGAPTRFPVNRKWMTAACEAGSGFVGDDFTDQLVAMTLSDTVFGFLGSGQESGESSASIERFSEEEEEESEAEEDEVDIEENKSFWESHRKALKETLCKSSTLERDIRNAAKEAMKAVNYNRDQGNKFCVCRRPAADDCDTCRRCLMTEISRRLRDAAIDSAVCKSKWKSSQVIPSGEHTFIEVVDNSNPKKGQLRVIIELNLRAEFEMGKANEEYNQLVGRLPEAFVGRSDRLRAIIKILSSAAKKCMKDKKMHMGPWRKHKYMLAKWFSTCQRLEEARPNSSLADDVCPNKLSSKPKASMLTVALLDMVPKVITVV
ncbi:hypothetical protein V2J09_019519 [Rumex salicifolius]